MADKFVNRVNRNKPHFIREWRKKRGLTIVQLAEATDVAPSTISRIENRKLEYTESMLNALALAIGCEPWHLLQPPKGVHTRWGTDKDGVIIYYGLSL